MVGPMPGRAIDPIAPRFKARLVTLLPLSIGARFCSLLRNRLGRRQKAPPASGDVPAGGRCGGGYCLLAWIRSATPTTPQPGGEMPGKRAHLFLSHTSIRECSRTG